MEFDRSRGEESSLKEIRSSRNERWYRRKVEDAESGLRLFLAAVRSGRAYFAFAFSGVLGGREDQRHKASHFDARLYCRATGRIRNSFGSYALDHTQSSPRSVLVEGSP